MFSRKPNPRVVQIDAEITRILAVMEERIVDPDSDEYAAATKNLTALCAERATLLPSRFSKDQILMVGGNVVIAFGIIFYERGAVITTNLHKFIGKSTR